MEILECLEVEIVSLAGALYELVHLRGFGVGVFPEFAGDGDNFLGGCGHGEEVGSMRTWALD